MHAWPTLTNDTLWGPLDLDFEKASQIKDPPLITLKYQLYGEKLTTKAQVSVHVRRQENSWGPPKFVVHPLWILPA